MEKINLAQGSAVFSRWEQHMLFHSERYIDVRLNFEEPGLASGFVQSLSMPGIQLTEISVSANEPVQLVDEEARECAESVFVLDGQAESRFHNLAHSLSLNKGRHNFQYNAEFTGAHTLPSGRLHALAITYEVDFLGSILQSNDSRSIAPLADALHGKKTYLADRNSLHWRGEVPSVLGAIKQCAFTGSTRYLFLESKLMELLALQLEQVTADKKGEADMGAADREKLFAVQAFIEQNYLACFTLKDLTYKFGLNEFKLKKGYKQLFETTVFGHVHQLRMKRAQTLLQEKTMNVSEAAYFIGYSNVSSFCTEFKKRFGYSPGKA